MLLWHISKWLLSIWLIESNIKFNKYVNYNIRRVLNMYEKVCAEITASLQNSKLWCRLIIDIRTLTPSKYCHEYINWEKCGIGDLCYREYLYPDCFVKWSKMIWSTWPQVGNTAWGPEKGRATNIMEKIQKLRVLEKALVEEQQVPALQGQ